MATSEPRKPDVSMEAFCCAYQCSQVATVIGPSNKILKVSWQRRYLRGLQWFMAKDRLTYCKQHRKAAERKGGE